MPEPFARSTLTGLAEMREIMLILRAVTVVTRVVMLRTQGHKCVCIPIVHCVYHRAAQEMDESR